MAGKRNSSATRARGAGEAPKKRSKETKRREHYAERTAVGETPAPDVRPTWWEPFFAAYEIHGTKTTAALVIGINRLTVDNYLRQHPGLKDEFEERMRDGREGHVDRLLTEVNKRGVLGFMEPVVYKGRVMYEPDPEQPDKMRPVALRKYSDRALELACKIAMPDKFRSSPKEPMGGAPGAGAVAPIAKIEIVATGPPFVPPEDDE